MRQSEFKEKYDPELGRYTRQHIYGEGVMDVFKCFGSKIFRKTMKKLLRQQPLKQLQRRLQTLVSMLVKRLVIK